MTPFFCGAFIVLTLFTLRASERDDRVKTNLLPITEFRIKPGASCPESWKVSSKSAVQFTQLPFSADAPGKAIGIKNLPSGTVSLYSTPLSSPGDGRLTGSVWAKGKGAIRLLATNPTWKPVPAWDGHGYLRGKTLQTSDAWRNYEFTFPAPESGKPFCFRVDIIEGGVELAAPSLTKHSAAEALDSVKQQNERDALGNPVELARLDFQDGLAGVSDADNIEVTDGFKGKAIRLLKDSRAVCPVTVSTSSGALAFWFKLDQELPSEKQTIWALGNSKLNSTFSVLSRITYGKRYAGLPNKIFPEEWHHIAYTWDATLGRRIYFDGKIIWSHITSPGGGTVPELIIGKKGKLPGIKGAIGDIRIFDSPLSFREVENIYAEKRPLTPFLIDYSGLKGKSNPYRIGFDNNSAKDASGTYKVAFLDKKGKKLREKTVSVTVPPGEYAIKQVSFTPPEAVDYMVRITGQDNDSLSFRVAILDNKSITASMKPGPIKKKLLEEIDMTSFKDSARYRDDGECRVSSTQAGTYLETTGKTINSGFAVKFTVKRPERPHWLEIDYPDDMDRTFYVAVGAIINGNLCSAFVDAMGVMTGGTWPVTGTTHSKTLLFYPESEEFAVVFGSHHNRNGEKGPAVSKIRLYENIGELPKLDIPKDGRSIMIWNEDPTMLAYTWFKQYRWDENSFDFWREKYRRMVKYSRFIGWKQWNTLGYDYMGDNTLGDRRLVSSSYSGCGGFLPGHLDMFAVTADREKIPFYISLNHLVEWNSGSLAGFGLETGTSNISSDFYAATTMGKESPNMFTSQNKLSRVRNIALNPLHPLFQKTMLRMLRAYKEKFAIYQCFSGIDYQSVQPLCFPDAESGYGDYNAERFKDETRTAMPEFNGPERFSARYEWLRKNAWEKWIAWRCRKVTELIASLTDTLDGKTLILRVSLKLPKENDEYLKQGLVPELNPILRERGIDIDALSQIKNLLIMPVIRPNYNRISNRGADLRCMNFSDELAALWKGIKNPVVEIMSFNIEIYNALGKLIKIKNLWNSKRFVSFATPRPVTESALENFAWAVANIDPLLINHGWWGTPENGDYKAFREFYKAFSYIPARRFETVPGSGDPVMARFSGEYLYMVNQARFPVEVALTFAKGTKRVNLVTGKPVELKSLTLEPLSLSVFKADTDVDISSFTQRIPEKEKNRLASTLAKLDQSPGAARARSFYDAKRYAATEFATRHNAFLGQLEKAFVTITPNVSLDGTLSVTLHNQSDTALSGELTLARCPASWKPLTRKTPIKDLRPGEKRTLIFRFSSPSVTEGTRYKFMLKFSAPDGRKIEKEYNFQPYAAEYSQDIKNMDKARWHTLDSDKKHVQGFRGSPNEKFNARFAFNWNESGLYLVVKVEDKDFLPPSNDRKIWENDSVVVYFDQLNNAERGIKKYDTDDLVFSSALVAGKAKVFDALTSPRAENKIVDLNISHANGETIYRYFFPSSLFPHIKFRDGAEFGFSVEIVNLPRSGERAVISTTSGEHPSVNPGAWADLILKK